MKAIPGQKRIFIWIVSVGMVGLIIAAIFAPKPIDWSYSFSKTKKIPFGNFLVFESLPTLFPGQEIVTSWSSPVHFLEEKIPLNTNFIIIDGKVNINPKNSEELIDVADAGNHVFVAAEQISGLLADTFDLGFRPEGIARGSIFMSDSVGFNFTDDQLKSDIGYWYPKWMTRFHISRFDTSRTTILGVDDQGFTNFIRIKQGKGSFYFHSNPLAFTNYHLLSRNNSEYIFRALSYLPRQATVWDEYYKPGTTMKQGLFDFVLNNPSLRIAWYILFAGVILLLVVGSRRKQRPIPVVSPPGNSSLNFVDTVSRLYFSRHDHLDVARKRFTYFLEFLRSKYYVNTAGDESRVISEISKKSGIPERSVVALFKMGNKLGKVRMISQEDLEQFNRQIEFFYNNCR